MFTAVLSQCQHFPPPIYPSAPIQQGMKCFMCSKAIPAGKQRFLKGKFFDGDKCVKAYEQKAKSGASSKKNVCEFC